MSAPADRSCRRGRDAGFTLIELVITLTLLSLLTLALFGSLRFGTRAWEASVSSAATADDVREAQANLTEAIQNAYPKLVIVDVTHAHVDFDGTQQSLMMLAPDRSTPGAMTHVTVTIEANGNDMALKVTRTSELGSSEGSSQTLLRGFSEAAFSYFGSAAPGDAPAWHDRWQDRTRLPGLVRLHAAFANGRAVWPDLIVAPKIAADIGCTFDPLTHFCQGR